MGTKRINHWLIGEKNHNWKGGKVLRNGYWSIKKLDHPFKDAHGYIFEHRLVMEEILGRYLKKNELVHHKDHNKLNNSPNNLELITRKQHPNLHPRTRNKKGQFT